MTTFRTVLLDPPWNERGAGKCKRGADRHYPVMGVRSIRDTILEAPVWNIGTPAHMYLWVTNNKVPDGLWLMNALNFRYITNLPWVKTRMGLGQYFRGKHELLFFGVRGQGLHPHVCTARRDIPTAGEPIPHMTDERGKIVHSAKPEIFRHTIEERSKGPYLEMFARRYVDGWTTWGNEV